MKNNYSTIKKLLVGLSGQQGTITIPRIFLELFDGDYPNAIFLNQIIYWSDKGEKILKGKSGKWFYKSYDEWHEEIGLSPYQIRRATTLFKKMGFLETERRKVNGAPTVHYQFLLDSFIKSLDNRLSNNLTNESENIEQSLDSEKNSQSINNDYQETTTKEIPAPPDEPKPKSKSEYVLAMEHLEKIYAKNRPCALPDWSNGNKASGINKTWRTPLKNIWNECEKDLAAAEHFVVQALERMKKDELTIYAPISIEKTAISLIADYKSDIFLKPSEGPHITRDRLAELQKQEQEAVQQT